MKRSSCGERLADVAVMSSKGVEAQPVAVLRLAVGEAGSATKPAPGGGVAVSVELLSYGSCRKGSKFLRKRPLMPEPCLEAAGGLSQLRLRVFISEVFRFEDLGMELVAEDFYKVFFRDIEIGEIDVQAMRFRPVNACK